MEGRASGFRRVMGKIGRAVAFLAYLPVSAWCALVVYYHWPFASCFFAWGYWLLAVAIAALAAFAKQRRPAAPAIAAFMTAAVIAWWFAITPTNNADWQTPWARMPAIYIRGDTLFIQDIRDFRYRSENDYEPAYISGNYDLNKLEQVMLVLSYWDGNTAVAHTILDFGFNDGKWLAISSETRLKRGQEQTALGGLFKQYGSLYIVGAEADLLMLRTNFRKEQVYLYPLSEIDPKRARTLLLDLAARCNRLRREPRFYNTITDNCMTSLIPSLRKVARDPNIFKDIRFLLNGYSDEMIYEKNARYRNVSFERFREDHRVTDRMAKITDRAQYSAALHGVDERSRK